VYLLYTDILEGSFLFLNYSSYHKHMDTEAKQKLIRDLLNTEVLGVVATAGADRVPQAALVGFTATDDLNLVFGTSNQTRKYQNLQTNPKVSFVIGTSAEARVTVQYLGTARELAGEELTQYQNVHLAKHPRAKRVVLAPEERMFLVSPTWIRYSDYKGDPKVIFELTDF